MQIAHLSDFHFRQQVGLETQNENQRSGQLLRQMEEATAKVRALSPDLLVVSGDLVDYPLDALDDPTTQAQGEADLRLVRDLLQQADCPLAVVYGNHDHPALYARVFDDQAQDFTCGDYRVLTFYDAEDADHVPHRTGQARKRFQAALTDSPNTPQIHVQHYLLWPQLQEDYPYNYPDHAELRAAMTESGRVRLSLSGHYHKGFVPSLVNGIYFAGVPAFCEAPHPLWVYDLDQAEIHATEYAFIA